MTYVDILNAFDSWLEVNYLSATAQLMFYRLVATYNRCGRPEWVTVDNQRLMGMIQCNREQTMIDTRNRLVQAGLIEYVKGKKGCPGKYKINTFPFKNVANSVVNTVGYSVGNSVRYSVGETVALIRDKSESKSKSSTPLYNPPKGKVDVFSAYAGEDTALLDALREFEQMRKKKHKPMTERAKELLCAQLDKLADNAADKVLILNRSIENAWTGVYALKDEQKTGDGFNTSNPFLEMLNEERERQ